MSHDQHIASFEYQKMQLIGSLSQMAVNMREAAGAADQLVQMIGAFPYGPNPPAFAALANGQFQMPVMPPVPIAHDEHGKKRKSRGDDADGKRKIKKPKDPNAPKRPPSSYLLFQNDVRSELKAKNPGMRNNELLGAIAKLWSEMPQEQKEQYEQRNKVAKDQWLAQKAVYEKAGESAVPVKAVVPAVAAPVTPIPVAAAADSQSSEEEEDDEEEESSSPSDGSSDAESLPPPNKKSKKEAVAPTPAKDEGKREKKHKKAKATTT